MKTSGSQPGMTLSLEIFLVVTMLLATYWVDLAQWCCLKSFDTQDSPTKQNYKMQSVESSEVERLTINCQVRERATKVIKPRKKPTKDAY